MKQLVVIILVLSTWPTKRVVGAALQGYDAASSKWLASIEALDRGEMDRAALLLFGDSMAKLKVAPHYASLIDRFGFGGFWASTTGGEIYAVYHQDDPAKSIAEPGQFEIWINGLVYHVHAGGYLDVRRTGFDVVNHNGLAADRFRVFYAAHPNGGEFRVHYRDSAGIHAPFVVVPGGMIQSGSTEESVRSLSFELPEGEYDFRIEGVSGRSTIIGMYIENSHGGICFQEMRFGGIALADMNRCPVARVQSVLDVLNPQLAFLDVRDPVSGLDAALDEHLQRFHLLAPEMKWILAGHELSVGAHDQIMRDAAEQRDEIYWRASSIIAPESWNQLGWPGDGVHLTDDANQYLGGWLLGELGLRDELATFDIWNAASYPPELYAVESTRDRNSDVDHDGASGFEEYVALTDPMDADSRLAINSIETFAGGVTRLEWKGAPGVRHTIEHRGGLSDVGEELAGWSGLNPLENPESAANWLLSDTKQLSWNGAGGSPHLRVRGVGNIVRESSFERDVPGSEFSHEYEHAWELFNNGSAEVKLGTLSVRRGTIGGSTAGVLQRAHVLPGRPYHFKCDVRNGSAKPYVRLGSQVFGGDYYSSAALAYPSAPEWTTLEVTFTADGVDLFIGLSTTGVGETADYDNFVLARADFPADVGDTAAIDPPGVLRAGRRYRISMTTASEAAGELCSVVVGDEFADRVRVAASSGAFVEEQSEFEVQCPRDGDRNLLVRNDAIGREWHLRLLHVREVLPWSDVWTGPSEVANSAMIDSPGSGSRGFFRVRAVR